MFYLCIIFNTVFEFRAKILKIFPVSRNNKYKKGILNDIYSNTDIKNISYYNKSNNYYIVKDDKYVYQT